MPTVVIIPVKSFRLGKQRLSDTLDDHSRETLGHALAGHTASAVEQAGLIPLIVTADPFVAEWATSSGFPSLADPGDGLNVAARSGVRWANASSSHWIVMHSDLPLLSSSDVSAVNQIVTEGRSVIAPSTDGGTSAIGSLGEFRFDFGVASFHRHLPRLPDACIVVRPGLALDVDSRNDLMVAANTPRGAWLHEVLA